MSIWSRFKDKLTKEIAEKVIEQRAAAIPKPIAQFIPPPINPIPVVPTKNVTVTRPPSDYKKVPHPLRQGEFMRVPEEEFDDAIERGWYRYPEW